MKTITVALLLALGAATAGAQVPERFENLQVLPQNISRDSLLGIMRGFSFALGARCVFCHVGEDNPTLAGVDFRSDDRPTKRTAREMLRMVAGINHTIENIPGRSNALTVSCMTCHRGINRPIALEDTLYRVVAARGGAAALAEYDSLRAAWHGRAAFDFGPIRLVGLAERLNAEKRHDDAVLLLRRNAEFFPRNWNTYFELGRSYEALGRREEAITAYRAVLERLPGHLGSTARLRALGG